MIGLVHLERFFNIIYRASSDLDDVIHAVTNEGAALHPKNYFCKGVFGNVKGL